MSSEIAIRVNELSKCYQIFARPYQRLAQQCFGDWLGWHTEHWALKNLSFEIKRGETVGVIGTNGSGKSTLLQLICGTLNQTSGEIEINGRVAALLELGAGFNPEFTGRENVYMSASIYGLSREEIDQRFEQIAAFADIGGFIEQPVRTYSSGMYVRLAFSVIAHIDADIMVIDEALAVGDVYFTQKCMRYLREFMKTGTVLFVSHDISAVQSLCTRTILLEKGECLYHGDTKQAIQLHLQRMYESVQGESNEKTQRSTSPLITDEENYRDMRADFINSTNLRNDIEIIQFDHQANSFGTAGVQITGAQMLDQQGQALSWIVGGEMVVVRVECSVGQSIKRPIVGFLINNKLGQPILGDNTFLHYIYDEFDFQTGDHFLAEFEFRMPILPAGDYSMTISAAEGTQHDHIQHDWIHDAIVFTSKATSLTHGLAGIPMKRVELLEVKKTDKN